MKTEEAANSLREILEAIDDDKSLRLLNFLAGNHRSNTDNHLAQLNMTRKEYYSRMSKFIKAGLVRRRQRKYLLTSFGGVIYELYSILGEATDRKIRPE
jgi:predicted transcriptional regulator